MKKRSSQLSLPPLKRTRSILRTGSSTNGNKTETGANVQVVVRCRPLNDSELKANSQNVVFCSEQTHKISLPQHSRKSVDDAYTFDRVFGPKSEQKRLYDEVVRPVVDDVLEGYNCTVFAYGQTGTGKTHTMEGGLYFNFDESDSLNSELPDDAGIIPRAVHQIFQTLDSENAQYTVKLSFIEIYNEEITDLLAPDEPPLHSSSTPIKIKRSNSKSAITPTKSGTTPTKFGFTPTKSGTTPTKFGFTPTKSGTTPRKLIGILEDRKGGVVVTGIHEEIVSTASDIYSLLKQGSSKRRTAETLLNKESSRSHSIFTITTYIKESEQGEEYRCGKLNLVDLAGSEDISKSGVRGKSTTEACSINKSLFTLGRVITALVENSSHVPYRESKLTRLLKDSLGGKTKTCIISTVSPSGDCVEETLSTLEYAKRAKKINNKPELNQKMSKPRCVQGVYSQIEKLRKDLRDGNHKVREWQSLYEEQKVKNAEIAYELELAKKEIEILSHVPDSPKSPRPRKSLHTDVYSQRIFDLLPVSVPPVGAVRRVDDKEEEEDKEERCEAVNSYVKDFAEVQMVLKEEGEEIERETRNFAAGNPIPDMIKWNAYKIAAVVANLICIPNKLQRY